MGAMVLLAFRFCSLRRSVQLRNGLLLNTLAMALLLVQILSISYPGQEAAAQSTSAYNGTSTAAPNSTTSGSNSSAGTSTPAPSPTTSGSSSRRAKKAAGGSVAAVVVVSALIAFYNIVRRKRRKRAAEQDTVGLRTVRDIPSSADQFKFSSSLREIGPQTFTLKQLSAATKNFSESRLLGKGGFGYVYKGILAGQDGTVVAVKRIGDHSKQGIKEFRAELTSIGNLRHRNLVKLKGWCYAEGSCMLVYEYMANGSLDNLLFHDDLCGKLTWERRWSIALGLGSALQYLHHECDNIIIHRDVKSSNVLLDDGFNAKLGDFGLSRQIGLGVTSHTTVLAGTRGYMGPELFFGSGRATCESDVFAFGAVLLEIVTGKCIIDNRLITSHEGMLLYWVWDMYSEGKLLEVVDERMEGSSVNMEEAKRLLIVALACSHPDAKARPSIRHAMEALSGVAVLPWVPLARPVPSYGPFLSMSRMRELVDDSGTDSSATLTASSCSAGNPLISGSSSDPTSLV